MKRVLGSIRRADERYHMIEDGDKLCLGVSGGKDSLLLMEALMLYRRFSKKRFDVIGVLLDLGLKELDFSKIEAYAERIGMPFEVIHTDIGKVVFEYREERSPCALCANLRRGALNSAAAERGCNKVVLGHNRDDLLETFVMSLLYEGRLSTFAPVTYMPRRDVTIIRPMIFLQEKYALSVAKKRELPILPPQCNIAGSTKRDEARDIIRYLTTIVPNADDKIMHAIETTDTYRLWNELKRKPGEAEKYSAPEE